MWKQDVVVARQLRAPCLTLGLLAISIPVLGAPTGVRACFGEKDPARRLACYDAEVGKMVTDRFTAHVAGITRRSNGQVVVRLDNDEVWEQSDEGPDLKIEVGDAVRIDRGMLGAYWLSSHSSVAIKVRRTQ
jgi:hypothetical protein